MIVCCYACSKRCYAETSVLYKGIVTVLCPTCIESNNLVIVTCPNCEHKHSDNILCNRCNEVEWTQDRIYQQCSVCKGDGNVIKTIHRVKGFWKGLKGYGEYVPLEQVKNCGK